MNVDPFTAVSIALCVLPMFVRLLWKASLRMREWRILRMEKHLFTIADWEREQRVSLMVATPRRLRWQGRWRLMVDYRPRFSLSFALIGLAVRRLPAAMTAAEKARWEREMKADAASLPKWRLRRIRFAFNLWRRGAPGMPGGAEAAARPARDL